MPQWLKEKNFPLKEENFSPGSHKKVWWVCDLGHQWEARVYAIKLRGQGCPICSNQKILVGFNDLQTLRPDLGSEWHVSKNFYLPTEISPGSNKKVWWICKLGHEWEATVKHRAISKTQCTVCSNRVVLVGFNDLATVFPQVASQWDTVKNMSSPANVVFGSNKKVWWICEKNHEWEAKIVERTSNKKGCPYCSGVKVLTGDNDFVTKNRFLLKEWNFVKNPNLDPNNYTSGSNKKVWWICEKNHEWEAQICDRVSGHGCKICNRSASQPEEDLAAFLHFQNIVVDRNTRKILKQKELDIYLPDHKIAIEFNGVYWHSEVAGKGKYYHYDKWKACKDKGIQLIQVWEDEWRKSPEQIKCMLSRKIGISKERRIFARKTEVVELNTEQSTLFLNQNHIQGAVNGGIRLGLVEKGSPATILAVMVLKREPRTEGKTLNLLRFATSVSVVGGFTKLLKHVEEEHAPESIITFSDNSVSNGGLYLNNGFAAVKELAPDYKYVVKGERIHKFQYRLKRFREDPNLLFEENLSERELAKLNNLPRIWDAGKIKWEKSF